MDILPASDGQTPTKVIVDLKDEDQMNKLFENLKKDVLNDTIKYLGKQEFISQDVSEEDIIDLEPSLSANNYKHKITNDTLINELKGPDHVQVNWKPNSIRNQASDWLI